MKDLKISSLKKEMMIPLSDPLSQHHPSFPQHPSSWNPDRAYYACRRTDSIGKSSRTAATAGEVTLMVGGKLDSPAFHSHFMAISCHFMPF